MEETNIFSDSSEQTTADIYFDLFLTLQDEISQEITLKGKHLINKLLPEKDIWKLDLDNSSLGNRVYYNCAVPILEEFCRDCVEKGFVDNFNIRNIEERKSGGIDLRLNGTEVLSVDIRFNKIYFMYSFKSYLFYINKIKGNTVEKIIADKCLSTLSKKGFGRPKDYYDLYMIKESGLEYDLSKIKEFMISNVGEEKVNSLLNSYIFSEETFLLMNKTWKKLSLSRSNDGFKIQKPEFKKIIGVCSSFYTVLKGG